MGGGGVGQYVSFRGSRRGRNMGTKLKSIGLVVVFLTYLGVHIKAYIIVLWTRVLQMWVLSY